MKQALRYLAVALALGVVYALAYRAAQPQGTPTAQIRATLLDATDALQQGQAGAAMRAVSSDYKDSMGNNRDRLYVLAREAARNRNYWNAVVENIRPEVRGDEATVEMDVAVRFSEVTIVARHHITLQLRREDAHAFLIVPTKRWRVVGAENLPMSDAVFAF